MQCILLFLILLALSPRLARAFGKFVVILLALIIGVVALAAWPPNERTPPHEHAQHSH